MRADDAFEKILQTDEDIKIFSGKMFMMWDGNHRLQAWLPIINRDHTYDPAWHYAVESIILDVKGDITTMFANLHEVNWQFLHSSLFIYSVHLIFFNFFIVLFFSLAVPLLFYFVRRNKKSHVFIKLVHKLFRIQRIVRQPLSYFEKLVSKKDLITADSK